MNYCTSCLRELNGVVSCPGCGTVVDSMLGAQDSPPAPWMRQTARSEQHPAPTQASRHAGAAAPSETAAGRGRAKARAGAHAAPRSAIFGGNTSAEPELANYVDSAGESLTGQRGRHSHRRRSLALRVTTATGGFAGIAVIGSLAFGNLSSAARVSAQPGAVAIAATPAQSNPNTILTSGTPSRTQTQAPTLSNRGTSSAAARNTTTTAASATSQSLSEAPNYATTSQQASQSPAPTASSTGAQSSPRAAQQPTTPPPTTAPASAPSTKPTTAPSSPSPSATPTQGGPVLCVLVLCL